MFGYITKKQKILGLPVWKIEQALSVSFPVTESVVRPRRQKEGARKVAQCYVTHFNQTRELIWEVFRTT